MTILIYFYTKTKMKSLFLLCLLAFSGVNCSVKKSQSSEPTITLNGTFESQQGVMTTLSCYCFNGGFLTTATEKQIPICFENNSDNINCKMINVTGFYKTVKNTPEPTSPCKKGEMTYFKVVSYKCL
jgi:hypothetical protein